ncbi:unnamed protein product [Staurois parvus]|uniref:G-protein coupled receptors family 1 profile domain-containing protein n=1 Tax=Staurois parvus TaxID=386267 RepID=A0ABN9G8S2_9NEOB|nr:unnamed protein product [Staurois parvus]
MNHSSVTEFILLGFSLSQDTHFYLFTIFLVIYVLTLMANVMIIILVYRDHHLHSPMYILLANFSFLEICYTAVTVPKMLSDLIGGNTSISVAGCITQYHFFSLCAATEHFLLVTMAYDRYVAICHPLHYGGIMSNAFCMKLILSCWLISAVSLTIPALSVSELIFCGPNIIDHFFCEFNPLLKLSCTDTYAVEIETFIFTSSVTLFPFLFVIGTYICIIITILKIPSSTGRWKTFSTCSSHLAAVCTYYGTLISVYVIPTHNFSNTVSKTLSLIYTVVTPMFNPIIYSLRNKNFKTGVQKCLRKCLIRKERHLLSHFKP